MGVLTEIHDKIFEVFFPKKIDTEINENLDLRNLEALYPLCGILESSNLSNRSTHSKEVTMRENNFE